MPRPLQVAPHLSPEELERCYRQAHDLVARSQFQNLWLLARGQSSAQVASATGYCREWVREVLRRYNRQGGTALGDRRHANAGQLPMLDDALCEALSAALRGAAPYSGLWRLDQRAVGPAGGQGPGLALATSARLPQHPRPRHAKGEAIAQAAFKNSFPPESRR